MQELEEGGGAEEPLTPEVEELLRDLQSDRHYVRLLGILVVGVLVIVGVFYSCTWVMVAQPTVGNLSLTTVVVAIVIMIGFVLLILQYLGLLAEIISFISRIIRKP